MIMPFPTTYEQDAEQYSREMTDAADAWVLANLIGFRALADDAMASYAGERGGFRKRMEGLTRLAADAAGFPTFADWLAQKYPAERVA